MWLIVLFQKMTRKPKKASWSCSAFWGVYSMGCWADQMQGCACGQKPQQLAWSGSALQGALQHGWRCVVFRDTFSLYWAVWGLSSVVPVCLKPKVLTEEEPRPVVSGMELLSPHQNSLCHSMPLLLACLCVWRSDCGEGRKGLIRDK